MFCVFPCFLQLLLAVLSLLTYTFRYASRNNLLSNIKQDLHQWYAQKTNLRFLNIGPALQDSLQKP